MKNLLRALKHRLHLARLTEAERRHLLVGPADLWRMKRQFQINFLRASGLQPQHFLLDIGCGTLRGGIPLIEYLEPGHYFGLEARKEVLDEGRKELKDAGLEWKQPTLIVSDGANPSITQKFDFIWAFSVLIHMRDGILENTLRLARERLSPSGVFYANVNIGDRQDGEWQGFPVVWRRLDWYEKMCSQNGLSVRDVGSLKELGHVSNAETQDQQRMLKITRC